jgi:predicted DNA-binding antitoxin AbrB/MazE fold protein
MSQIVNATYEDGVLRPDKPLALPASSRVRLVVEPIADQTLRAEAAWRELERLRREHPINSGGLRYTRDELHERD